MPPKSVLHKTNGHRHLPKTMVPSAGMLMGLVHSDPAGVSDLNPDLLRFAAIIRTECAPAGSGPTTAEADWLPEPLARSLAHTREKLDRGEMPDIRRGLAALRAQADIAARMITRLVDDSGAGAARTMRPQERVLVNVNQLVIQTLDLLTVNPIKGVAVSSRLVPGLRPIVGDFGELQGVLTTLIASIGRAMDGAGRAGMVTVETSGEPGVLRGEGVVRIRIMESGRPEGDETDRGAEPLWAGAAGDGATGRLHRVARVVGEHGGALSAVRFPDGGVRFTLEFPAV
jgi:hypothetical protein